MEGAKISKSAGKFPVLDDLLNEGINPLAFRLMCFGAKYRSELAFSLDAVRAAEHNLEYLLEFVRNLSEAAAAAGEDSGWARDYANRFHEALNHDLNTAQALASALEMIAEAYRRHDHHVWNTLKRFDLVMGLRLEAHLGETHRAEFPAEILHLRDEREQARKARDFQRADELRRQLDARGYQIRDSETGPVLMPKRPAP